MGSKSIVIILSILLFTSRISGANFASGQIPPVNPPSTDPDRQEFEKVLKCM